MEKIEVGEFVRTEDGYIGKCQKIDVYYGDVLIRTELKRVIYDFEVANHSFDIKDLVEKGDFVNGYEVDDFDGYDEEGNYFENDLGIPIYDDANMDCIVEYRPIRLMEIKSIVTREMFQKVEYRMEE